MGSDGQETMPSQHAAIVVGGLEALRWKIADQGILSGIQLQKSDACSPVAERGQTLLQFRNGKIK
jgi:hypothetical protein